MIRFDSLSPLGRALALVLFLACLPSAAGELTNPADCDKLPGASASVCKREFLRTGSFSFARLTREKECQKLRDSSLHAPCREAISSEGSFYASTMAPRPIAVPTDVVAALDSSSRTVPSDQLVTGFVDETPKSLEERNTQALETIATYTKVQTLLNSTLVGLGVVIALIALIAD